MMKIPTEEKDTVKMSITLPRRISTRPKKIKIPTAKPSIESTKRSPKLKYKK